MPKSESIAIIGKHRLRHQVDGATGTRVFRVTGRQNETTLIETTWEASTVSLRHPTTDWKCLYLQALPYLDEESIIDYLKEVKPYQTILVRPIRSVNVENSLFKQLERQLPSGSSLCQPLDEIREFILVGELSPLSVRYGDYDTLFQALEQEITRLNKGKSFSFSRAVYTFAASYFDNRYITTLIGALYEENALKQHEVNLFVQLINGYPLGVIASSFQQQEPSLMKR